MFILRRWVDTYCIPNCLSYVSSNVHIKQLSQSRVVVIECNDCLQFSNTVVCNCNFTAKQHTNNGG